MQVFVFLITLSSLALADIQLSEQEENEAIKALENPDLLHGDMFGIDLNTERNGIIGEHLRWPNGVVPYVIDRGLAKDPKILEIIKAGMKDYHDNTCIRFKQRDEEENYIRIFAGQGCYSMVGMMTGIQFVSLGNGCWYTGTVVHELGHALGFYHEQNRSDRDDYITVQMENVIDGQEHNFVKLTSDILYNTFDYESVMIYGNNAFSKNGKDTMTAKNGVIMTHPFKKKGLNASDKERVNKMYKCKV